MVCIGSPLSGECGFVLILLCDMNLMVIIESICKWVSSISHHIVYNFVIEQGKEGVMNTRIV